MAVTQPRRVAAVSVAHRVAEEMNCRIGDEVAYQIRFDDRSSRRTKILFLTDGCLVRICLADPDLSAYSVIMLDEAHERSIHTDILFGLLKRVMQKRKDLKVLVTSATLQSDKFGAFFGSKVSTIPGRTFPVDVYHSRMEHEVGKGGAKNSRAYIKASVDLITKIHAREGNGHVLCFLTGQREIEDCCEALRQSARDLEKKFQHQEQYGVKDGESANIRPMRMLVVPLYG